MVQIQPQFYFHSAAAGRPVVAVPDPQQPILPAMPADGEIFELTIDIDGDAPEKQPLEMVFAFGYDPKGWRHTGKKVAGKQTRRFKRVGVGRCRNLEEVQRKLASYGEIPEGQWISAFKKAYPQPDEKPTGVADPSWVGLGGLASFPCVDSDGVLCFRWALGARGDFWRWLVTASNWRLDPRAL